MRSKFIVLFIIVFILAEDFQKRFIILNTKLSLSDGNNSNVYVLLHLVVL